MVDTRLWAMITVIFLIVFIITFALHKLFERKAIKYIPAGLFMILSAYYYYLSTTSGGMENLGRIVMAMLLFVGSVSGLISGLILELLARRKNK